MHQAVDLNYFPKSLRFWGPKIELFFSCLEKSFDVCCSNASDNPKNHIKNWNITECFCLVKSNLDWNRCVWIVVLNQTNDKIVVEFEIWLNQLVCDACLFHRVHAKLWKVYFFSWNKKIYFVRFRMCYMCL